MFKYLLVLHSNYNIGNRAAVNLCAINKNLSLIIYPGQIRSESMSNYESMYTKNNK